MDIPSWIQLAVVCFLGAISPGPSLALVIGNTLARGRAYGVATGLGHAVGIGWWALLTAVGVAEFMVNRSGILLGIQALGACLLAYIGFRTLVASGSFSVQRIGPGSTSQVLVIRGASEGFLIALLNPKVALFFLAIFSHLVPSDSSWKETVMMGITAAAIDAGWYASVAVALTGTSLVTILHDRITAARRGSGLILILISLYLLAIVLRDRPWA
jgi:threonine/homoserine/homoserine lactone efflux protein